MPAREMAAKIDELLDFVGIKERKFSSIKQLSWGMNRLATWHLGIVLSTTAAIAVAASSAAAWQATRIEPAEALRDE
jgi:ABC-type lipoprotein release transport system permease subunit